MNIFISKANALNKVFVKQQKKLQHIWSQFLPFLMNINFKCEAVLNVTAIFQIGFLNTLLALLDKQVKLFPAVLFERSIYEVHSSYTLREDNSRMASI